ncbi:dTMP kinase [bacterium]|nr:dTMP kinase [bacterium]
MKKGLFITVEGLDGCGKSTQLSLLSDYLLSKGYEVEFTREPGSKGLGESVRNILLNYDGEVSNRCEAFLFLADRAQNIDVIVKPAVEQGKIVLSDRHIDSTLAYQGYARGGDIEQLKYLNNLATNSYKPDLTFVFDISVETSLKRVGENKDRMESENREFFEKVRQGYLEIAKHDRQRVKVIDSETSIETIFEQVKGFVDEKLV